MGTLLDFTEASTGWKIFKVKFTALCDKHAPKIQIKETFKPPWFDSEVFRLNKKKEHLRKMFNQSNNQQHYKKFSSLRKELKNLIKVKMRSNFDDDAFPNTITKKFWSSVKSSSKSSGIPEKMYLDSTDPFEAFQKRCIKWIHKESFTSYNEGEYVDKLKSVEILPIKYFFLRIDLLLFFKIIHELVPIAMPHEITNFIPRTRSNTSNLYKYQLHENVTNTKLRILNSFFVRAMTQWNRLPDDIRVIVSFTCFESALDQHLWSEVSNLHSIPDSDREPD